MLSKIKYCFLWFAIFHFLIQTLCAKQNSHCSPSSCGSIRNISYPFRLKHDPSHCGNPDYELGCENNKTTFLTILSHKYIVKTINYSNYTIRLMDSSMDTHHNCSFPNHSLSRADFELQYLYRTQLYSRSRWDRDSHVITSTVTVMSCPSPANNPFLVDISPPTCVGRRRHTYVKLGNLNTSYLMEMCRIEMMTMTSSSSSLIDDEKSVSLSEIHSSLVYGFELSWLNGLCEGKCRNCWLDGNRPKCDDRYIGCFIGIYWDHWEDCGGLPIWFRIAILATAMIIQYAICEFLISSCMVLCLKVIDEVVSEELRVRNGQLAPEKKLRVRNTEVEPELSESELLRLQNDEFEPELQFKGPITRLRAKNLQGYFQVVIRKKFEDLEDAKCSHILVNLLTNEDRI